MLTADFWRDCTALIIQRITRLRLDADDVLDLWAELKEKRFALPEPFVNSRVVGLSLYADNKPLQSIVARLV